MRFEWFRRHKISLGAVLGLSLLAGLVVVVLPEVARRWALGELERALVPPVSIEDIDFNPFTGRATISNFVIGSTGTRRFLYLPSVEVHLSPLSYFRGNLSVHSLRFVRPEMYLERTGPKRFNVMELLRQPGQRRKAEERPFAVTIESVMIEQGKIGFVDDTRSPSFSRTLENVTLKTSRISTLPDLILTPSSFEMRLNVGEGSVAISGKATPLARPAGIELTSQWENLDPGIIQTYLPERPALDFSGSWFSGELYYVMARQNKEVNYLTANVQTGPGKLLAADGRQPVLSVTSLSIEHLRWDFLSRQRQVARVVMNEPHMLIERETNGRFNTSGIFRGDNESNRTAPPQEPGGKDSPLQIAQIETRGGTVEFLDHKVTPSIKAIFRDVELGLKDFSLAPAPAQLEAKALLGQAPVQIKGTLQARPFTTRLQIAAKNLPLEPYQGYLKLLWPTVDAWEGNLDGQVQLALVPAGNGDSLSVELSGDLEARKLALGLPGAPETPFHAERARVQLSSLRTQPAFFVDISRISLIGADLRVRRDHNGNLNLRPLWASPRDKIPKDAYAAEPRFTVQALETEQSSIEFVDAAVEPTFRTTLTQMSLNLGKLGRGGRRTPVTMQATLTESAEVQLKGWIELFGGPAQINLDGVVRDYDLSQLNPYATKYIRYEIKRGRVMTDVQYTYNAGDLSGENKIAIRQLQLGKQLGDEFEERIGVPLSLAVALLQDADGQIRLTVPVSGNLRDPQFDFGSLFWNALHNAIVRFLSAPLRLIGNIVTFGDRITQIRIEPIHFKPGSTELTEQGEEQLKRLAELTRSKPKVELEIHSFVGAHDIEALKKQRFREAVKAEGGDYETAVARLYRRSRGLGIFARLPSLQEMENYLTGITMVPQESLDALAKNRIQVVEKSLIGLGVDSGRLWPGSHNVKPDDDSPGRLEFRLLA